MRSELLSVPSPTVVRLRYMVKAPRRAIATVSRRAVFARDDYRCQYCHRTQADLRHRECLTRDHLVPLSRGGTNDWTNVVTACSSCNTRKGNHLPEECGMLPLHSPHEPHFVHLAWAVRRLTAPQAKYIRMFYGKDALQALNGTTA
jgi:5-methylcytosine-specific restriction endonuclease McrA